MPTPNRADLYTAAVAVAADMTVPADWPRTGRAWPSARSIRFLRRALWPVATVTALLPSATAAPTARHKPLVRQPVAVVPLAWLEALAARLGVPLADVCRGLVPDET